MLCSLITVCGMGCLAVGRVVAMSHWKFAAKPTTEAHMASLRRWSPYALKPNAAFVNSDRTRIQNMMEGIAGVESNGYPWGLMRPSLALDTIITRGS